MKQQDRLETSPRLEIDFREPLKLMSMRIDEIDRAALDAAHRAVVRHCRTHAEWVLVQKAYERGKEVIGG